MCEGKIALAALLSARILIFDLRTNFKSIICKLSPKKFDDISLLKISIKAA